MQRPPAQQILSFSGVKNNQLETSIASAAQLKARKTVLELIMSKTEYIDPLLMERAGEISGSICMKSLKYLSDLTAGYPVT